MVEASALETTPVVTGPTLADGHQALCPFKESSVEEGSGYPQYPTAVSETTLSPASYVPMPNRKSQQIQHSTIQAYWIGPRADKQELTDEKSILTREVASVHQNFWDP